MIEFRYLKKIISIEYDVIKISSNHQNVIKSFHPSNERTKMVFLYY